MLENKVQLDVFEGPLDLLLYLVKKEEVDIYEVNLTKIATQFIEYIELMRELDLDMAGEFLVMASTLMYIKSRELLPVEQQTSNGRRGGRGRSPLGTHPAARRIQEVQGRRRALAGERSRAGERLRATPGQVRIRAGPERRSSRTCRLFDLINAVYEHSQALQRSASQRATCSKTDGPSARKSTIC